MYLKKIKKDIYLKKRKTERQKELLLFLSICIMFVLIFWGTIGIVVIAQKYYFFA